MRKQILATVCILMGAATIAQQAPRTVQKQQFSWTAEQSPEMKRLTEALFGVWKTTEKFEANEFLSVGATGEGIFFIYGGPGGNSLTVEYKSQSSMGSYSSTRVIYWDRNVGLYRAFYCDSLQPTGCGEAGGGSWEGKDLVFESTTEGPGGVLHLRQRFSGISNRSFTFSLDMIGQNKSVRSLTIQATKSEEKS